MSSPKKSGTIGILTSETSRFSRFWLHFAALEKPPGIKLISKMSLKIPEARDEIISEAEGDWVWFIDDDHTFKPDLLLNLLKRDVSIVQPLVLSRMAPFTPVMMGPPTEDGTMQYRFGLTDGLDKTGLKSCGAVGAAGMLIRRHVWEKVGFPYFSPRPEDKTFLSEDIAFCRRAKAAGFGVFTDLSNHMGHLNVGEVWPQQNPDGTWATKIIFGDGSITIPKAGATMKLVGDKVSDLEEGDVS